MSRRVIILFAVVFITKILGATVPYQSTNALTFLHTDRYCYVSGNYILINAYHNIQNATTLIKETALYVDLVDVNESFIKGEIFKINNGIASGFLQIPDTLKTGEYLLRAYTNHSKKYTNKEILFKQKVYVSNRFGNNGPLTNTDLVDLAKPNDSKFTLLAKESELLSLNIENFRVSKREKISIKLSSSEISSFKGSMSVKAISPYELYYDSLNYKQIKNAPIFDQKQKYENTFDESKGIIYSGKVVNKQTLEPLPNILVIASVEGTDINFRTALTDADGNFNILLNSFYNNSEFYFNCFVYPSLKYHGLAKVIMNSKFLSSNSTPMYTDDFSEFEKSNDTLNVLKATINKAYSLSYVNKTKTIVSDEKSYEQLFLLGKNSHTTNLDDYIELIDFAEVVREIVPFARIKEKRGKYSMSTVDPVVNIVRDNAIVFVDGVPLRQLNKLISTKSNEIARIDVMGEPRYYGNIGFENGLVFVWTRKSDFWEKMDSDQYQSYSLKGLQSKVKYEFPNYSNIPQDKIPDFRQTLYWNPDIKYSSKSSSGIEFYSSDEGGWFELVLNGISDTGKPILIRDFIYVE